MRSCNGRGQRGAFLLEALVALLIMAFGILGIVGLQAQSMRVTNDSEYRAEAVYLANSLVGKMWTDTPPDPAKGGPAAWIAALTDNYDSTKKGPGYVAFQNAIVAAPLPGVVKDTVNDPVVKVDDGTKAGLSTNSVYVTITVFWQLPGEKTPHQYVTSAVIGLNS